MGVLRHGSKKKPENNGIDDIIKAKLKRFDVESQSKCFN